MCQSNIKTHAHFFQDSQDGKFGYGYASCPGKRSSMEDFYETRLDSVDGEIVGLFGVFDGKISAVFCCLCLCLECLIFFSLYLKISGKTYIENPFINLLLSILF